MSEIPTGTSGDTARLRCWGKQDCNPRMLGNGQFGMQTMLFNNRPCPQVVHRTDASMSVWLQMLKFKTPYPGPNSTTCDWFTHHRFEQGFESRTLPATASELQVWISALSSKGRHCAFCAPCGGVCLRKRFNPDSPCKHARGTSVLVLTDVSALRSYLVFAGITVESMPSPLNLVGD